VERTGRQRRRGPAEAGTAGCVPAARAGVAAAPVGGQDAVVGEGERVRVARLHLRLRLRLPHGCCWHCCKNTMECSRNCTAIVAAGNCECGWGNYRIGMEEREESLKLKQIHDP
jgi:hypothetical protein